MSTEFETPIEQIVVLVTPRRVEPFLTLGNHAYALARIHVEVPDVRKYGADETFGARLERRPAHPIASPPHLGIRHRSSLPRAFVPY